MTIKPGQVVKKFGIKPLGVYFVMEGELAVSLETSKDQQILLNRYRAGQSCSDPDFNLSAHTYTEIKQISGEVTRVLFIPTQCYKKVFGDMLNVIWSDR
jgi:CRP-like cAMP-binding protein